MSRKPNPKLHYIDSKPIIAKVAEKHGFDVAAVTEMYYLVWKIIRALAGRTDMPTIYIDSHLKIAPDARKFKRFMKRTLFKYKQGHFNRNYLYYIIQRYSLIRKFFKDYERELETRRLKRRTETGS